METTTPSEMRICHFSDLHLAPPQRVPLAALLGKRALGYANLMLNRGRTHKREHLVHLVRAVATEKADINVVTGDLTSLSLDFELRHIDRLFRDGGLHPANTLLIPGNHDRYTFAADYGSAFEIGMVDWLPPQFIRHRDYPIVREIGPVVLFALDTAVWRNPVRAAGVVDEAQLSRLTALLDSRICRDRWPVIAMHHAPFRRDAHHLLHYRTGLIGYEKLIRALGSRPATLIHGHLHMSSRRKVGTLDIIGVPSASNNTGVLATQLAYYMYTFSEKGLLNAEAVRLWPSGVGNEVEIERAVLPEAIAIDE